MGFDIDAKKIESLSKGESYLKHISSKSVAAAQEGGQLESTTDFGRVKEVDALIL